MVGIHVVIVRSRIKRGAGAPDVPAPEDVVGIVLYGDDCIAACARCLEIDVTVIIYADAAHDGGIGNVDDIAHRRSIHAVCQRLPEDFRRNSCSIGIVEIGSLAVLDLVDAGIVGSYHIAVRRMVVGAEIRCCRRRGGSRAFQIYWKTVHFSRFECQIAREGHCLGIFVAVLMIGGHRPFRAGRLVSHIVGNIADYSLVGRKVYACSCSLIGVGAAKIDIMV